mgnify:FL=1
MRARLVVFLILFCTIQPFPQQEDFQKFIENKLNSRTLTTYEKVNSEFLLTQSLEQEWINSAWQNVSRSTTSYDSSSTGYLITTEIWDNNQWVNESQLWYVYNENDLVTEEVIKTWVDPNWVNSERYLYEYDTNENVTVETSQSWNATEWVNSNRYVYTFVNNVLTEELYQQWNVSDWIDVDRYQYTYVNNNLTETLYQQFNSAWDNVELIQNFYDNQNNIIETLNKRWESGNWFLEERNTHQYSNGNLTVVTMQEGWIDTIWTNIGLYTKNYNSNNFLIEYISQYWHSLNGWINQQRWVITPTTDNKFLEWVTQFWQNNNWENFSRLISTYDANGNETVFAWEMWENSAWQNHVQILFSYTLVSSVEEDLLNKLNYSLSQNYPNPFNPNTVISYQLLVSGDVTLKIYDVLGNEIATLVNEFKPAGKYEIDFQSAVGNSQFASGVYFYQLKTGNYLETKKMILLR